MASARVVYKRDGECETFHQATQTTLITQERAALSNFRVQRPTNLLCRGTDTAPDPHLCQDSHTLYIRMEEDA